MILKKIVIVGAGGRGKLCSRIAKFENLRVEFFIDNNEKLVGTCVDGVKVISPQNVSDVIFVISVYGHETELTEQLLGLGVERERIISITQFIKLITEDGSLKDNLFGKNCLLEDYPQTIQFPITYKCNFNCVMCGVHDQKTRTDMTPEQIGVVLGDEYFSKVKGIGINGGEPFLRKDLVECVEQVLNKLPSLEQIFFISNGFFTDKIIKDLCMIKEKSEAKGVKINLSISVDAYGKQQDFHRGHEGAFNNAENTIDQIKKNQCVDYLDIITTITKYNIERINELAVWAEDKNVNIAYNIASEINRISNENRINNCSVMIDDNARMLAQEFFYTKYKQTGSERYFSIFEFLQGKGRVAECPCVHNEWITVTPDGYIGFCSPHGAILGALNGSNARSLVTENIKQVEAVRREKCSSCSQYMYEVNRYGLVLLVQDQINESRRITS